MRRIFFLIFIVQISYATSQRIVIVGLGKKNALPPFELKGTVFSGPTGEKLIGANLFIERQNLGTSTNAEGQYSFELYPGVYEIKVSVIGYEPLIKRVNMQGPGSINFPLNEKITELDEVIFEFNSEDDNVSSKEIGTEVLTISSIKTLPLIGGEVNILNSLTLLPGVSTQGEASSGFNVRGGSTDQNLILLGGATLYNPYHLFGFFSGFNASVVRDVSLHKGAIPARFGGRASSVVDVAYKKGNFKQWEGDLTLGSTASKFSTRGPIMDSKLAFMGAGRIAYPNVVLRSAKDPDIANSTASFYDGNVVFNYAINEKNNIEYSFYTSSDAFKFPNSVENQWKNLAQVLKWNSELNDQLLFDVSVINSTYTSNLIETEPGSNFDLERFIKHNELNLNINYSLNEKNDFSIGAQYKQLENNQGKLNPGENSSYLSQEIGLENASETGLYFEHSSDITKRVGITYGVRYSFFSLYGPATINTYDPNQTKSLSTIISSREYGSESIQTYDGLEPRAALNLQVSPTSSVKIGFNRLYQYIHLITNTTSISPTDSWKLSDPFIAPQTATQYSFGLFKNFFNNRIETSVQGFYKVLDNIPAYKDGAALFLNANLETELTTATGRAYGLEFFLNKSTGRMFGWLSYTYSRSFRTISNGFDEEVINKGEEFPSSFDRPHNLSTVFNYRFGSGLVFSSVFNYSTGSPFTLPQGKFSYNDLELGFFNERNNFRAPANHRLDLSIQFSFSSKKKIWSGLWTLSIYNIYGRKNPFSVFFQDFPGSSPQAYKLSVVGSPFPSLSYELKF